MASLKDRFKSGLKAVGAAMTGGVGAAAVGDKKKRLHEGMMKATGQSKDQAAKIKRRTDIAAKRKSAGKK